MATGSVLFERKEAVKVVKSRATKKTGMLPRPQAAGSGGDLDWKLNRGKIRSTIALDFSLTP